MNDILAALSLLAICQLAGEVFVNLVRMLVPAFVFPGPVAGMLLLLAIFLVRGRAAPHVQQVANGLLAILSLLFIPSAVGIVQYLGLISTWIVPLAIAILVSTLATLLVTVFTYLGVERWLAGRRKEPA